jgi:hypothetical protein
VQNDNRNSQNEIVFSRKIRAGRRRTYFLDVRTTRASDYYLIITESKKRFDGNGYERHKVFLYKEDFNKFQEELNNVIDHIKNLMPDFDFAAFDQKDDDQKESGMQPDERGEETTTDDKSENDAGDESNIPQNEEDSDLKL